MGSNSLERETNHSEEQVMDCVSFVLEYMHQVIIYIQINILMHQINKYGNWISTNQCT